MRIFVTFLREKLGLKRCLESALQAFTEKIKRNQIEILHLKRFIVIIYRRVLHSDDITNLLLVALAFQKSPQNNIFYLFFRSKMKAVQTVEPKVDTLL